MALLSTEADYARVVDGLRSFNVFEKMERFLFILNYTLVEVGDSGSSLYFNTSLWLTNIAAAHDSASKSKSLIGFIAAGVVGGLILIAVGVVAYKCRQKPAKRALLVNEELEVTAGESLGVQDHQEAFPMQPQQGAFPMQQPQQGAFSMQPQQGAFPMQPQQEAFPMQPQQGAFSMQSQQEAYPQSHGYPTVQSQAFNDGSQPQGFVFAQPQEIHGGDISSA
jgi:hypothetical protein